MEYRTRRRPDDGNAPADGASPGAREGNIPEAQDTALRCIRLSRKIEDKHELGAALRILGDIHVINGQMKKAVNAYEESIRLLRNAKESYD